MKVVSDVLEYTGPSSAEATAGLPLVGRSHRCKTIFAFLSTPSTGEVVIFAMCVGFAALSRFADVIYMDARRYVHEYSGETKDSAEIFVECVDSTPLHPEEKV